MVKPPILILDTFLTEDKDHTYEETMRIVQKLF